MKMHMLTLACTTLIVQHASSASYRGYRNYAASQDGPVRYGGRANRCNNGYDPVHSVHKPRKTDAWANTATKPTGTCRPFIADDFYRSAIRQLFNINQETGKKLLEYINLLQGVVMAVHKEKNQLSVKLQEKLAKVIAMTNEMDKKDQQLTANKIELDEANAVIAEARREASEVRKLVEQKEEQLNDARKSRKATVDELNSQQRELTAAKKECLKINNTLAKTKEQLEAAQKELQGAMSKKDAAQKKLDSTLEQLENAKFASQIEKDQAETTIRNLNLDLKLANEEITMAKAQVVTVTRQAQKEFIRFKTEAQDQFSNLLLRESGKGMLGKMRGVGHAFRNIGSAGNPTPEDKAHFKTVAAMDKVTEPGFMK